MIIPIGHDQSLRKWPIVTLSIIAVCTLVQLYATVVEPSRGILDRTQPDPAMVTALLKLPLFRFGYLTGTGLTYKMLTAAFVHAGWIHLIGNMIFLMLAGSVLEDRWGELRYAAFYGLGIVISMYSFLAFYHGPQIICVGASGAIAAAMGSFLVYYGGTRITFWYWLGLRAGTFQMSAYAALPLWLIEQVVSAALDDGSGVAYTAHIGGFCFGAALALVAKFIAPTAGAVGESDSESALPMATAVPSPRVDRYAQAMKAIAERDLTAAGMLSGPLIQNLAQLGDTPRLLALYRALGEQLPAVVLSDTAFAAVAAAADSSDGVEYIAVANAFANHHPHSPLLAKVLWRQAQHYRSAGRTDLARAALEVVVERFPTSPVAASAARELAET